MRLRTNGTFLDTNHQILTLPTSVGVVRKPGKGSLAQVPSSSSNHASKLRDPHKHSITGWQVTLSAFLLLVPQLFGKNEICPPQPLQPRCFRKLFFSGEANDHPTPVTGH
ncbi:hypothetical protein AVEN_263883-1 [Araneus ventricosus]|uniref:Uncharacterized protein n=1 Tax=Araneus ventricosus TaxID=182803 RepID=A0A4Y2T9F3_ARAVE|nr:hypothetical protein AVEN_102838-1 [Araneus ventricosus]GBN97205.1 hypothetical protein AVEN_263883-1 [Araneus ventricosus]